MPRHVIALALLLGGPVLAFLLVLNRDVPMARLDGFDARCMVCDRKATRTLKRAADDLRTKGLYIYRKSDYPGGIPAWCDLHGPNKMKENSTKAYFAAIFAFAAVGTAYEKARKTS